MADLTEVVKQLKTGQQANEASLRALKGTFDKYFMKLERHMLDQLEADIEARNAAKKQGAVPPPGGAASGGGDGGFGGIMGGITKIAAGLTALGLAAAGLRGWELPLIRKLKDFFTSDKKGSFGRLFRVTFDSMRETMERRVGMLKDIWGKDPEKSLSARMKAWFDKNIVQRMRRLLGMDFAEVDKGTKLNFRQQAMQFFDNLRKGFLRQLGISMEIEDGKKANVGKGTVLQQVRAFFRNETDRILRNFGLTMKNVDMKTGKFTEFTTLQKIRNAFNMERGSIFKMFGLDNAGLIKGGAAAEDVSELGVIGRVRQAFTNFNNNILKYFGLNPADYKPRNPGRVLATLGETAGGLLDKVKDAFRALFKPVVDVFKGIKGFFAGTIGKGIADFLRPIKGFASFLGRIFKPIGFLFSLFAGFEAYKDEEGGVFKKLTAGVAAAVADFFGAPLDLLGKIVAWVIGKLGFKDTAQAIKDWQKESGGFTGILDRFMRKILGMIGDGVNWVLDLFPSMDDMKKAGKQMLGALDFDFANPIPLIGEKIAQMMEGLADYAYDSIIPDALGDWAMGMADSIRKSWGKPSTPTATVQRKDSSSFTPVSRPGLSLSALERQQGGASPTVIDASTSSGDTIIQGDNVLAALAEPSPGESQRVSG
jgi:hypothetical protein